MGLISFAKRWFGGGSYGVGYAPNGRVSPLTRASAAGPIITETTALTIPAFFAALRMYAQTLGSLEWNLIEIRDDGRYIARDHPVHRLLHDEPNEFQVASSFRETLIGHAIQYGNGYAYIERNGNFRPTGLIPLMPWSTYPTRINGQLIYKTMVNGVEEDLMPYEVFHLPGFGGNGLTGYPIVQLMRDSLGLTKAETEFAASFFRNGCNFGGTVSSPGNLSAKALANLKDSMHEQYSGVGGAFRWLFLEEGLKAEQFGTAPESAQLLESRQFSITELSRMTGLPAHLLGDLSRAGFSSVEHLGIEAVTYAFKPWANKACQEANRKLLYENEKDRFITDLDVKPLMAGDSKTQAEVDQIRFNTASITPNEIRVKDGRNPVAGGDELYVNAATIPLSAAIQRAIAQAMTAQAAAPATPVTAPTPTGDEPTPDPTKANEIKDPDNQPGPHIDAKEVEDFRSILAPMAEDTVARLIRREAKMVETAVRRHEGEALRDWATQHEQENRQHVAGVLSPVIASLRAAGHTPDLDAVVMNYVTRTKDDVLMLAASEDREADLALMLEGWQGRTSQIVNDLMGDN